METSNQVATEIKETVFANGDTFAVEFQVDTKARSSYKSANLVRDYILEYHFIRNEMTTAELIGAYQKLVDTGFATDADECALLDLLNPFAVQ